MVPVIHGPRDGNQGGAKQRDDGDPHLEGMAATVVEMEFASEVEGDEGKVGPGGARVARGEAAEAILEVATVEGRGADGRVAEAV